MGEMGEMEKREGKGVWKMDGAIKFIYDYWGYRGNVFGREEWEIWVSG